MEIKGKVHYVGVNDRTKALFENLWPLPYGVSYNSYLIADDDMVALVDTVDVAFFEVYIKKIRSVIGDRKINYLIIRPYGSYRKCNNGLYNHIRHGSTSLTDGICRCKNSCCSSRLPNRSP